MDAGGKPKKRAKRRKKMDEHKAKVRKEIPKKLVFSPKIILYWFQTFFQFIKEPEGLDEFARELNAHFDEIDSFELMVE